MCRLTTTFQIFLRGMSMLFCKGRVLCFAIRFWMLDICGRKFGQSLTENAQWCDGGSHESRALCALRVLTFVCWRSVLCGCMFLHSQDILAQMTQLERSWSLWFGALCEQHGRAHGLSRMASHSSLPFSLRFQLCELSFWIAENDIDTWAHLDMAPAPGTWRGAGRFDSAALEQITQLQKRRSFCLWVCRCSFVLFALQAHQRQR